MARDSDDGQGMLGSYDFLIIDEAHDFPNAATNGLEFEMSMPKLNSLLSVAGRIESTLAPLAQTCGDTREWSSFVETFREQVQRCETSLMTYGMSLGRPGILTASPSDVLEHPQVKAFQTSDDSVQARELAMHVSTACEEFVSGVEERVQVWKEIAPERARNLNETVRNYGAYLRNYGRGCHSLFSPEGVSVSYVGRQFNDTMLRQDVIDLAGPLKELLWDRMPYACLSATLALDGTFDFFRRVSGAEPDFEEILPSPFNAAIQSSIYIPANGRIPDPTVARRDGVEEAYYRALAGELTRIIVAMGGRTLALFHSRKEMEGVASFMSLPPELPMIVHSKFGASGQGDRFRVNPRVSLFALRSFWTGFDAPGETLSCVALVRIPFEVPVDPPQIARLAFLQTQGRDAFREHTLPNAKMLMRQGAGRLIRRIEDRGVIALLDPRLRSKAYGEEILSNVAGDVAIYDDFLEAMAKVGIDDFALI
jgi:ATP-dependent DNA helicase DinG